MKVFLSTAAIAAIVLCVFLSETLGAKPASASKGNAITTRKSKLMNWESTPGYGIPPSGMPNGGPDEINPACVVCRVLSRTRELDTCITDQQVLIFFNTMKNECVKDLGIICPNTDMPDYYTSKKPKYMTTNRPTPRATTGYRTTRFDSEYGTYGPGYQQYRERGLPLAVTGNRMARNALCIACFTLARFNGLIECLFDPEDLPGYETFMQGCAGNFFMCIRT